MNDSDQRPFDSSPSTWRQWLFLQWRGAGAFFCARVKKVFLFTILGMVLITALTMVLLNNNQQVLAELWQQVSAMFAEKEIVEGGDISLLALFLNNVNAGAFSIGLGIIPFLFLPIYSLFVNGVVVGVMGAVMLVSGLGLLPFLAGILPHGIFEIPALALGISSGIRLCLTVIRLIFRKTYPGEFFVTLKSIVRLFFFWMVPLFAVAAVIETYITPVILLASMP